MKFDFSSKSFSKYCKTGDIRSFEKKETCCFCGKEIKGYGNNPAPVKSSVYTCCDMCNREIVIPTRLKRYNNES